MTTAQLLGSHLKHDLGMMKWHLDDFTDADMFVRPCSVANHAMWQAGHVIGSTGRMLAMIDASFKTPIGEELTSKFTKEASALDDTKQFPTLEEIRAALTHLAEAAGAWVAELPQSKLDEKSPDWAKDWAATNGLLIAGIASHVQMHIGQLQVIRRKLGKSILF